MRLNILVATMIVALFGFSSCDEDTALIGQSIMPEKDFIATSQDTFVVKTQSWAVDSILANTSKSMLGAVIDPDTRAVTTAGFVGQFHLPENFRFPKADSLVLGNDGLPQVDSVDLYLYVDSYYGDSLRTMKLTVQELDTAKVIEEGRKYYTNFSPEQFLTKGVGVSTSTTYSIHDDALITNRTSGYHFIRVKLPISLGKRIIAKYYQNPLFYKNSQSFLRHVFAGLYIHVDGSVGSMLNVPFATLNVLFHYKDKGAKHKVYAQFATTEEVIQNTSVTNKVPVEILNKSNEYTYVKSPATIFTEGAFPVSEIFAGHEKDSINNARLTIRQYREQMQEEGGLEVPKQLLLVSKSEMKSFFEKNKLPDNRTSFLSTLTKGAYTFHNVGNLIGRLRALRDQQSGVLPEDNMQQRQLKYSVWEAKNPDWNKFVLVPVSAEYTVNQQDKTLVLRRLRHLMKMGSVKLEGGTHKGVELHVMYTSFHN